MLTKLCWSGILTGLGGTSLLLLMALPISLSGTQLVDSLAWKI